MARAALPRPLACLLLALALGACESTGSVDAGTSAEAGADAAGTDTAQVPDVVDAASASDVLVVTAAADVVDVPPADATAAVDAPAPLDVSGDATVDTTTPIDAPDVGGVLDAPDVRQCAAGTTLCAAMACVDLATSLQHCGRCDNPCSPAGTNMTASCRAGTCGSTCAAGWTDCDHNAANGCETQSGDATDCGGGCVDLRTSVTHCGGCASTCELPPGTHATPRCTDRHCAFTCDAGYADMDGVYANGCEAIVSTEVCPPPRAICAGACVDPRTDLANCGACGNDCSRFGPPPFSSRACVAGTCANVCEAGRGDCDGIAETGCETVILGNNVAHCGACNSPCRPPPNRAVTCVRGACVVGACIAPYADCDGDAANGCETNTTNNNANCGACGALCSAPSGFLHGSARCVASACTPSCSENWGDCDGVFANGCETNTTNNNAHCGRCGAACLAGQTCRNNFCS